MKNITILDCTLRDGGYYTNWDFDAELVKTYFKSLNRLPVEWIELGYRSLPKKEYLGEYFYCPDYVLQMAAKYFKGKIAIMFNEKDIQPEHVENLLKSAKPYVHMIRLAIDPKNIMRAVGLAKEIKRQGFQVGFNVMYMSKWKQQPEFLDQLPNINGVADYLYMVDSYGGIYPDEIKEILQIVKQKVTIPVGFHGHNNMELALINAITAIESGAELIDATITGMGRGAGNLKTELLLTALNAKGYFNIDFNVLSDVTHSFEELQLKFQWGTNLPYMVSGANSLPQKDVMDWVGKRYYSYNSIIRALHNQKNKLEDNEKYPLFSPEKLSEKVMIVGGGPSVLQHKIAILQFLNANSDISLVHASSKNVPIFKGVTNRQYFCLVGIEGNRLEMALAETGNFSGNCVLPAFPRKMGTYVPDFVKNVSCELANVEFTDALKDAHTTLALQTSIQLQANQIYVIGYDGYGQERVSSRELELFNENEYLFSHFKLNTGIMPVSLTPTKYSELKSESVYGLIV